MAAVVIATILASALIHHWAINNHWVGGEFLVPVGDNISFQSNKILISSIHNNNPAISHKAWSEYKKRGTLDNKLLLEYINLEKDINSKMYIESLYVQDAVQILSDNNNADALPILKEMLNSDEYQVVTTNKEQTRFYSTRSFAKILLKKDYGIDSPVKTEIVVTIHQ